MKKNIRTFINLLLAFITSVTAYSQVTKVNKEEGQKNSKIESFSLKTGSLIRKEFTMIGSVKRIEVEKLVLTDILTNIYLSGVKLETAISQDNSTTIADCFLDSDEVDAFVKSAKYILAMPASKTDTYVELNFTSRGGFQAGAYSDDSGSWKYYIKLDQFDTHSYVMLDKYDFERLSELLSRSK